LLHTVQQLPTWPHVFKIKKTKRDPDLPSTFANGESDL